MQQAKFSLSSPLIEFVGNYQQYGFKDRSALVRAALTRLKEERERYLLEQSADLYAALYAEDTDLQELTNDALTGWPE